MIDRRPRAPLFQIGTKTVLLSTFVVAAASASALRLPTFDEIDYPKPVVAIAPFGFPKELQNAGFAESSVVAAFGASVADHLTEQLKDKYPEMRLPARRDMDKALAEIKLSAEELVDNTGGSLALGKFLKADYLIVGSVIGFETKSYTVTDQGYRPLGDNNAAIVRVSAKLIDIETSDILDVVNSAGERRFGNANQVSIAFFSEASIRAAETIAKSFIPMFSPEVEAKERKGKPGEFVIGHGRKQRAKKGDKYMVFRYVPDKDLPGFVPKDDPVGEGEIVDVQADTSLVKITSPRGKSVKGEKFLAIRIARADG